MRRLGLHRVVDFVKALPTRKSTATEVQEMKKRVAEMEMELQELKVMSFNLIFFFFLYSCFV